VRRRKDEEAAKKRSRARRNGGVEEKVRSGGSQGRHYRRSRLRRCHGDRRLKGGPCAIVLGGGERSARLARTGLEERTARGDKRPGTIC